MTDKGREWKRQYMREWNRRYYAANREREIARSIAYIKAHPKTPTPDEREKQLVLRRASQKRHYEKYRNDDAKIVARRVRCRTRDVLRHQKANKANSVSVMIGCTPAELKAHLESMFLPGMTWVNKHLWHIDHIRPCASFNLTDPEQQRCCFHFTNLQPLWARDNQSKKDKVLES